MSHAVSIAAVVVVSRDEKRLPSASRGRPAICWAVREATCAHHRSAGARPISSICRATRLERLATNRRCDSDISTLKLWNCVAPHLGLMRVGEQAVSTAAQQQLHAPRGADPPAADGQVQRHRAGARAGDAARSRARAQIPQPAAVAAICLAACSTCASRRRAVTTPAPPPSETCPRRPAASRPARTGSSPGWRTPTAPDRAAPARPSRAPAGSRSPRRPGGRRP